MWPCTCMYCDLDFGWMTLGQGHGKPLGLGAWNIIYTQVSWNKLHVWPAHEFNSFMQCGIDLGVMTLVRLGQCHDTLLCHRQISCEVQVQCIIGSQSKLRYLNIGLGIAAPKRIAIYCNIKKGIAIYCNIHKLNLKTLFGHFRRLIPPKYRFAAIERQSNRSRHQNNCNSLEIHTIRSG